MEVSVKYEEYCSGCKNCKSSVVIEKPQWRWWHVLIGTPKIKPIVQEKDYSKINNENCGRIHETVVVGSDLIVENEQNEVFCTVSIHVTSFRTIHT